MTHETIDITKLIEDQRIIVTDYLRELLHRLQSEEEDYRSQFRAIKLSDTFPSTIHYYFEKLRGATRGSEPFAFGKIHLELIVDCIEAFKTKLAQRGKEDSAKLELELTEEPISQLEAYFGNSTLQRPNSRCAFIFASFLRAQVEELIEIAEDLDRYFSASPSDESDN
jgi:hypothetical protein